MNDTIKTLMTRRSVREFEARQIKDEELKTIIDAGLYAPSAMNTQPWHFVVVQNKELLARLETECSGYKRRETVFYNAPTLIVVFCDKETPYPVADGSLAIGNMYNAAASIGVGACWINCLRNLFTTEVGKKIKSELYDNDNYEVVGSLVLGYQNGELPERAERRTGTVSFIR